MAALKTFEKIMGDRPTFLDVSYLALGYQRSKSVAKLRMRFPNAWHTGTAFLVKPDTLLTPITISGRTGSALRRWKSSSTMSAQ